MKGHVVTQFLDMCLSSNSTAAHLYNVIDGKLAQLLECETLGICALLLVLTTLQSQYWSKGFSEVKDNKKESFCVFL